MPKHTGGGKAEEDGTRSGAPDPELRPSRAQGAEYAEAISGMLGGPRHGSHTPTPPSEGPAPRSSVQRKATLIVLIGMSGLAGWSLYDYYLRPVAPPPPESQRRAGQIMLFNAVQAIEAERLDKGTPPEDLTGLILPKGNFEYVLADTGYTLGLTLPDVQLSHRSGDDVHLLLRDAGVR